MTLCLEMRFDHSFRRMLRLASHLVPVCVWRRACLHAVEDFHQSAPAVAALWVHKDEHVRSPAGSTAVRVHEQSRVFDPKQRLDLVPDDRPPPEHDVGMISWNGTGT
jgi:hypothetical protein